MKWIDVKMYTIAVILMIPIWIPLGIEENYSANSFQVIIRLFRVSAQRSRLIQPGSELWLYSVWNAIHYAGGIIGKLSPIFAPRRQGGGSQQGGRIHAIIMGQICIGFPGRLVHVFGPDWLPEWWLWIMASRLASGYILGLCNTYIFVHLAEISNPFQRGSNTLLYLAVFSFGSVVGVILGFEKVLGNYQCWQYPYLISLIFCFISIVSAMFIPESPSFWAAEGNLAMARKSLIFYQGDDRRLKDVILDGKGVGVGGQSYEGKDDGMSGTAKLLRLLRRLKRPNLLSVALAVSNTPSQFFVVYSTVIFNTCAGIPLGTAQLLSFILRIVIMVVLLAALWAAANERAGSQTRQFRVTSFINCTSLLLLSLMYYCIIQVQQDRSSAAASGVMNGSNGPIYNISNPAALNHSSLGNDQETGVNDALNIAVNYSLRNDQEKTGVNYSSFSTSGPGSRTLDLQQLVPNKSYSPLCLGVLQAGFVACVFVGEISISLGIRSMFNSYVPELYPYQYRVLGKALGGAFFYTFATLVTLVFFNLIETLRWASFLTVSIPSCLSFAYCCRNLPETRGHELHEIQRLLMVTADGGQGDENIDTQEQFPLLEKKNRGLVLE